MESTRRLEEISDGKIYDIDDYVKADGAGCQGCSACCHYVGELVSLTPFDIYDMTRYLDQSFTTLMKDKIQLGEVNKVRLPYLKMIGSTQACSFLNEGGRCEIHQYRPNICRLFPLGRVYEGNDFKYFLQVGNCKKKELKEVSIRQWIGIERYEENKAFLLAWHQLIKALEFRLKFVRDEMEINKINQLLLEYFYIGIESKEDFYEAFFSKLPQAKKKMGIL